MRFVSILLSAILMLCIVSPTRAGFAKGDFELRLSGSGASDKNLSSTDASADVQLGYFLTDAVEFSVRQSAGYAGDDFAGSTAFALDYNFNAAGRLVPYIGIEAGASYGQSIDTTWQAGAEAGVRWFLTADAFVFLQSAYVFEISNGDLNGFDSGSFVHSAGLGIRF